MLYELTLTRPFESSSGRRFSYDANILTHTIEPEVEPTEATYGVELELNPAQDAEAFDDAALNVFAQTPCFFVKNDGSISDAGGELVTVPQTLAEHTAFFNAVQASNRAFSPDSNCGFHVHALKPNNVFTLARVYEFINAPALSRFNNLVARRQPTSYCQRDPHATSARALEWAMGAYGGRGALAHGKGGTVEFRLFASSVKRYELASYVEYADALIVFCSKRLDHALVNIIAEFVDFVHTHAARYPNLNYRINARANRARMTRALLDARAFSSTLFVKVLTPSQQHGSM